MPRAKGVTAGTTSLKLPGSGSSHGTKTAPRTSLLLAIDHRQLSQLGSNNMAFSTFIMRAVCAFAFLLACAEALKFELLAYPAHDSKNTRCIRNFVSKDTLVMVTSTIDGSKGDGMQVNIHVS